MFWKIPIPTLHPINEIHIGWNPPKKTNFMHFWNKGLFILEIFLLNDERSLHMNVFICQYKFQTAYSIFFEKRGNAEWKFRESDIIICCKKYIQNAFNMLCSLLLEVFTSPGLLVSQWEKLHEICTVLWHGSKHWIMSTYTGSMLIIVRFRVTHLVKLRL